MPFTRMLFMKALEEGFATIAGDLDLWRQLFPPSVPQALADGWFSAFSNGGTCRVKVAPAYIQGSHRPPIVIVREGASEEDGTPMAFDSVTPDIAGEVDSYRVLREQQTIAVTVIAPTLELQSAIHACVQASILDNINFFYEQGIRGLTPAGSSDIEPNEDMPAELLGTFIHQGTWRVREDVQYPRLIPNETATGEVGVAFRDAEDHLGSPGRVTESVAPPEVVGVWPVNGTSGIALNTVVEARFSRRMDATTTMAAISVTEDDVAVDAGDLTITMHDDPATNVGALRQNRVKIRKTGGWSSGVEVGVQVSTDALSDTGSALSEAAAWTFQTAG